MDQPPFNWFNPRKAVRVYRGNLPHWRQDGCLYFLTFRLADSIPHGILAQWEGERRTWLEAHGIKGYPDSPHWKPEFDRLPEKARHLFRRMNARRLFSELDRCRGECLLRSKDAQRILAEGIRHFDGDRWHVGDFVVMPNHVHALVQVLGDHELENTLYSVKRFSARKINEAQGRKGRFWQKEYYDHIVRDRAELHRIRTYIESNPSKAGLGESEFVYSRASWLTEVVAVDL